MATAYAAAQEYRTIDVAIGNLETEHLTIEGLDRRQLFDEEHHVAYVDRLRAVIHRAWRINPPHIAPLVNRLNVQRHRDLLSDLHPQRHAVGILALEGTVNLTKGGLAGQFGPQSIQRRPIRYAPGHTA